MEATIIEHKEMLQKYENKIKDVSKLTVSIKK